MKVLVVEDDANTREGLLDILSNEGYDTVSASNGKDGLAVFVKENPDFVCLDVMMPAVSGYDVCKEIRRASRKVPVIFISAKSQEIDKVLGLELGADDYIVKPFGVKEVVARIRAVTRRCMAAGETPAQGESFRMGDLEVAPSELRARRGKKTMEISLRDLKILQLLYRNRCKVLDRDRIFDECWGVHYSPNSRSLDQHISQLRKRIETDPANPKIIKTVHGAGYRFDG